MERQQSIFSKIRSKIEGYQKRQQEKELERKERRQAEEVGNLVTYPDFNHLANCPKQSGIRTYILSFGEGGWGTTAYLVRGVCKDCDAEQALD
ncbi:hypothetical protein HYW46_07325 [Candidatus Daviesbacteria bacterium]|nr:hypothetical protein [Candidatus Daviesbacteria bacterium]